MSDMPPPPPPNPYPSSPMQRPPTYLVWAILSTIFCCLPLGIPAIVYAAKVDGAWDAGRYEAAMTYSKRAKNFAIGSAVTILAIGVLWFGVGLLAALADL
jgi:hypothetical protein